MKPERARAGLAPSAELVRRIHAERGRPGSLRRLDGAHLLPRGPRRVRPPFRARRRWPLAGALAVAASVVAALLARGDLRALSYAVEGASVARGGAIESDAPAGSKVRFSDGSEVSLARGSRVVLRHVDGRGARVALDSGKVHVDVVHRADSRWLFDAGPFQVTVTGTAFVLGWAPADQRLDVSMERGSVEVRGPLSDGALSLRSGQHLVVRVREREAIIRDLEDGGAEENRVAEAPAAEGPRGAEPAADRPVGPVEPAAAGARGEPPAAPAPRAASAPPVRDWASLVAGGDFESVVRDAERVGLDRCLAQASGADLASLADAARYGRHDDLARRTLLAERRRFPASSAAHDAAFLLGRLEETDQRAAAAIEWFGRYLAESPAGTYASEALGRKMVLTQQTSGDAEARALASEYVGRFPRGTYAARARALTAAP